MNISFLSDNMNFSGGRKLLFEYANFLTFKGHQVNVLVQEKRGGLADMLPVAVVKDFSPSNIPESDIIVATTPREVKQAYISKKGKVVHFCQGFEIVALEQRIEGAVIPARFNKPGVFNSICLVRKKISWVKKKRKIDKIYQLPTYLITVSKHLKTELEKKYQRKVDLCVNGIRKDIFFPHSNFQWGDFTETNPVKIVSIGPYEHPIKGMDITFEAIKRLKEENIPIEFIRITPKILKEEYDANIVDKFYENISSEKIAELLRSAHVYISNSTEGEGFGLPAMEAMSCGLVCILSSISSYKKFSNNDDFCLFVPEHDVGATVESIKKVIDFTKEQALVIRNNGLETAQEYTFENSCKRFEEILQNINQS